MYYFLPAHLYCTVYLLVVFVLTIMAIRDKKRNPDEKEKMGLSFMICLFFIWFIGNRPVHVVFCDMMVHAIEYVFVIKWEGFDAHAENIIFDNLMKYMADGIHAHYTTFFQLMSLLFFLPMYYACRKIVPNQTLLAFLAFLGAFVSFGASTNGFKGGVACSFFALGLAYRYKNIGLSILCILISLGFHHSMQLMLASFALTFFVKDTKYYFYGWAICLILCVLHVNYFQEILAGVTDEKGAGYLNASGEGASGFRPDFVLYSAVPIVVGAIMKFKYEWKNRVYDLLLQVYLTSNALWLLCMYSYYTNRIASLSWSLYSLVLLYPCFMVEDKRHFVVKNRNLFVMAHLGFTMFMQFIVYGSSE